jgi:hypothetical protein
MYGNCRLKTQATVHLFHDDVPQISAGNSPWDGVLVQTNVCKKYNRGATTDFVAYYRVSIDRSGASGLGLDAQRRIAASQDLHPGVGLERRSGEWRVTTPDHLRLGHDAHFAR